MPPAQQKRVKSRNWAFTLNNYTPEEIAKISKWHEAHTTCYIIYGKEVGDGSESVPLGTPHLQGYMHFPTPQAASAVKKLLPRAHIELCKGTPADNIAYCSKEGDITVFGIEPKTQQVANKEKAARFIALAKAGDFATIEAEQPGRFLSSYRTMQQIATDNMKKPKDLEEPCGVWITGSTGCGKTTAARTEYGTYFMKPCNKWWDGYQDEDCVIIEDMDPNHSKLAYHLKLWTDKWSFTAEVKGGTRSYRPKVVIITSQYTIEEVFEKEGQAAVDAIKRRCKVRDMDLPLTQPDGSEELHDYEVVLRSSARNVSVEN